MIAVANIKERLNAINFGGLGSIDITTAGTTFVFSIGPQAAGNIADPPEVTCVFYTVQRTAGAPTTPTVVDSRGTVWTLINSLNWTATRTTFLYCTFMAGASKAAGTLTFTHSVSHTAAGVVMTGLSGVPLTGLLTDIFAASPTNTASSSLTVSVVLPTPKHKYNRPFYYVVHTSAQNTNFPGGISFIKGNDWQGVNLAGYTALAWQPYNANNYVQTVSGSAGVAANWGIMAYELRVQQSI